MPQLQLPIFPDSCTLITPHLGFQRVDDRVVYFNGHMPVFSHASDDIASFRLFSSQLVNNGSVTQSQIARAFGVPLITVKRRCVKLRDEGSVGFFQPKPPAKGHRLTPDLIAQAQVMLDAGAAVPAVSSALGVLQTTLHKAITAGRLKKNAAPNSIVPPAGAPAGVAGAAGGGLNVVVPSSASVPFGNCLFIIIGFFLC